MRSPTAGTRATITFEPDEARQAIVDSWPEDVDDAAAGRDWGFVPKYDLDAAFENYLIPSLVRRRIPEDYAGPWGESPRGHQQA